jgi:predicted small lipoprotein YifL
VVFRILGGLRMIALSRSTKTWIAVTLLSVAGAGVAGCGVKGPLEPPPGAKAAGTAKSAEAADPGKNSDAPPKPHESFLLDPLLR